MQQPAARLILVFAVALAASAAAADDLAPSPRANESYVAYRRFLASGGRFEARELFTAGSRVYLARGPHAAGAEAARLAELDAGSPLRAVVIDGRAALIPRPKKSATRPVLMERVGGTWRIDLVETEKSFEPVDKGGLRIRYEGSPYQAVLASYPGPATRGDLEPLDLFGEDPASAIARLESAASPVSRFRLAEILLRNCWLVDAAMPLYEEAVRGAPEPWPYARQFGFRALVVGQPDRAIPVVERFQPEADQLLGLLHSRAGRFEESQRYMRRSALGHLKKNGILEPIPPPQVGPGFQQL